MVGSNGAAQAPSAADQRARQLFEEGRDAFAAGDFETALSRFRAAYAQSPRSPLLYNIATSADRLRRDDVAIEYYRRYLEAEPDAPERPSVEARVAAIERARTEREHTDPPDDAGSVFEEWWLWTIVAVVVGAAVATTVVVASGYDREPVMGEGGIVFTLESP